MSFWEKMKQLTRPYSEEEYDDYEEEMEDYGAEETQQEPARDTTRRTRRTSPFADAPGAESQTKESASASAPRSGAATETASAGFSGQVINMSGSKQDMVLFHAKSFDDAAKAATELRKKRAVILNMENVDKALTRRVVDFLSGAVYALDGTVKKVAQSTYLFCPNSMNVMGDLENVPKDNVDGYV